jgi:hypothetical protein
MHVEEATEADCERVLPILAGFNNAALGPERWRRLFDYSWPAPTRSRGFLLRDGDRVGGFFGSFVAALSADFSSGADGFTVDNSNGGLWHLSTGHGNQSGHSASQSFYYGQGEDVFGDGTYNTTARNTGTHDASESVGLFINTLPARIHLDDGRQFAHRTGAEHFIRPVDFRQ